MSHTLQTYECPSCLRAALEPGHNHPGETSGEISKHSICKVSWLLLKVSLGTRSSCTQHLRLVKSLPTASLMGTCPLGCATSVCWVPLHAHQNWLCSRPYGTPRTQNTGSNAWGSWKSKGAVSLSYLAWQSQTIRFHLNTGSGDFVRQNILVLLRL